MVLSFAKRNCFALSLQTFFVLAFIGGYIAFMVTFIDTDRNPTAVGDYPPKLQPNSTSVVLPVIVTITSVSPADYTMKVTVDLSFGDMPPEWFTPTHELNHTLTIGVGTDEFKVPKTATFKPFTAVVPLQNGSLDYYPFDSYTALLDVYAYDGPSFATSDLEIYVFIERAINYGFTFTVDPEPVGLFWGETIVKFNFDRTNVFRLYPVFLILAFWFIGIFWCALASHIIIWNRAKVEPPILGTAISLLFALPAFRNTAPQSPPIGCTLDVCSFYWVMLFVVLSVIGLIIRYMQGAPPAPANTDLQQLLFKKLNGASRKVRGIDDDEIAMEEVSKK